jgi:hypothetical protein
VAWLAPIAVFCNAPPPEPRSKRACNLHKEELTSPPKSWYAQNRPYQTVSEPSSFEYLESLLYATTGGFRLWDADTSKDTQRLALTPAFFASNNLPFILSATSLDFPVLEMVKSIYQ